MRLTGAALLKGDLQSHGIYLLDAENRTVLFLQAGPISRDGSHESLRIDTFAPIATLPSGTKLTAIAVGSGALFVTDSETKSLFRIGLSNARVEKIDLRGFAIKPAGVAVNGDGTVVVGDSGSDCLVWISKNGTPRKVRYDHLKEPGKLTFDAGRLLVLDHGHASPSVFSVGSVEPHTRVRGELENIIGDMESDVGRQYDMTAFHGIVYLAAKSGAFAIAPQVPALHIQHPDPAVVAVSEDVLLVANSSGTDIRLTPRVVPVRATLEGTPRENNRAVAYLYGYLEGRGHLAWVPVAHPEWSTRLDRALLGDLVLLPGPGAGRQYSLDMPTQERDSFVHLFCEHNQKFCGKNKDDSSRVLSQKIHKFDNVRVPEVYMASTLTTEEVPLGRKSIQQYITERLAPRDREQVSQSYLAQLNAGLFGNMDAELARQGFASVIPPIRLDPGVVRIHGDRESPISMPTTCFVGQAARQATLAMPAFLKIPLDERFLPAPIHAGDLDALRKLGVATIDVGLGSAVVNTIDGAALLQSTNSEAMCARPLTDSQNVFLNQTVTVGELTYSFHVASGHASRAAFESVQQKVRNRPGVRVEILGDWLRLKFDGPLTIGYKAVRFGRATAGLKASEATSDIILLKRTNLLASHGGVAILPKTSWKLFFLAEARELDDAKSGLRKFEIENDELYIWSAEASATGRASVALEASPDRMSAVNSRRALLERISYPPALPNLTGLLVGVAKKPTEVDFMHPAFCVSASDTIWSPAMKISAERCAAIVQPQVVEPLPRLIGHHGTHVASILATGSDFAVPGLLPNVKLFAIDPSSPESMEREVRRAIEQDRINVVNLSLTFTDGPNWISFKKKLRGDWKNRLFVVAAGNEGRDLADYAAAPVTWIKDLPDIVVVGAADRSKHLLNEWLAARV